MSDDFTRGFLEGVEVAARIVRNHIGGIRQADAEPATPANGPTLAQDGLAGAGGTSGQDEGYEAASEAQSTFPADHPQPMTVWTPPTVGFYRVPEETD